MKNAEAQVQQNNIHDLPFHLHWVRDPQLLRCQCLRFGAVFLSQKGRSFLRADSGLSMLDTQNGLF